jgi:hypothetical protein
MALCSISGVVPEDPVVCTRSGYVYERSLATKHIESTGTEPTTGETVSVADLLPLRGPPVARPRPLAASSVQGLLSALQGEWDSLMLEHHALRQALEATRQELSTALYNHDAACRVVARLIRERDAARQGLAAAQSALASRGSGGGGGGGGGGDDAAMAEEGGGGGGGEGGGGGAPGGVTQDLLQAIADKNKELAKGVRCFLRRSFPFFFRRARAFTPPPPSSPAAQEARNPSRQLHPRGRGRLFAERLCHPARLRRARGHCVPCAVPALKGGRRAAGHGRRGQDGPGV